jgi:hypothetical protein
MWATGFSVVIGLLLPIRAYVGTLGQPRLGPRRAPSLIDLLGITGYFALVPFPLLGAIGQGFAPVAIIYGGIMFGACAGPALALLGNSMRARAAGVVLGLGVLGITAGFIYLVANQAGLTLVLAMLSGVAAPLAPLFGVVILRLTAIACAVSHVLRPASSDQGSEGFPLPTLWGGREFKVLPS